MSEGRSSLIPEAPFYTVDEVATIWNVATSTLVSSINQGRVAGVVQPTENARSWRIPHHSVFPGESRKKSTDQRYLRRLAQAAVRKQEEVARKRAELDVALTEANRATEALADALGLNDIEALQLQRAV